MTLQMRQGRTQFDQSAGLHQIGHDGIRSDDPFSEIRRTNIKPLIPAALLFGWLVVGVH